MQPGRKSLDLSNSLDDRDPRPPDKPQLNSCAVSRESPTVSLINDWGSES